MGINTINTPEVLLELTNVDTLFEIFDKVGDAVESYTPCVLAGLSASDPATDQVSDGSGAADSKVAA